MSSNEFYTRENLRLLVNFFKNFLFEKHDIVEDEAKIRKITFDIMTNVMDQSKGRNVSLKIMNTTVINAVRSIYAKIIGSSERVKKPNIQVLSRENMIYGNRQLHTSVPVPDADPYLKRNMDTSQANMERLILDRDKDIGVEKPPPQEVDKVIRPITESSESEEDFIKRVQEFQNKRRSIVEDLEAKRPPNLIVENNQLIKSSKYNYVIDIPKYKNPVNISVSKVVIPFALEFPYIILMINEYVCKLIYHRSYQSTNGRFYTILKPIQKEKRNFLSLHNVNISLCKPNGALFNNNVEPYLISKIEYEAHKIKITCNNYFNNNEFKVGDLIIVKDLEMINSKEFDEGFHILELGPSNTYEYYNEFYIQAPGSFDASIGQFIPKTNFIDSHTNGVIINISSQHAIALNVDPTMEPSS